MHIELKAGEQIEISFKDADGVITVAYGETVTRVSTPIFLTRTAVTASFTGEVRTSAPRIHRTRRCSGYRE